MNKLTPEANPRPVPRNVRKSMQVARNVSGKAVQVSSFLGMYSVYLIQFTLQFKLHIGTQKMVCVCVLDYNFVICRGPALVV